MESYAKALELTKNMPKVYLGQEVKTPIGKGIVVKIEMQYNGLYIMPERSSAVVWFSTDNSKEGWICKEFFLTELQINYRKEKLENLKNVQEKNQI